MAIPSLFVIAGPNGSGKSLFSKALSAADYTVFDGDKHMTGLSKKFSELGSEAIWKYIDEDIFAKEKLRAISENLSYAYETNFSFDKPLTSAKEFKDNGYDIHLIFMGLNSVEESIERVAHRVASGGHKVSEESIKFNFENGYKNLYQHFWYFTSVTLIDNSIVAAGKSSEPREILHLDQQGLSVFQEKEDVPEWASKLIALIRNKS